MHHQIRLHLDGETLVLHPQIDELKEVEREVGVKACRCGKTKCLKLYCECFASRQYCRDSCECQECANVPSNEAEVMHAVRHAIRRNSRSFLPKIKATSSEKKHLHGCRCKRSACLKRYCECFSNGVRCGAECRCRNCQNVDGSEKLVEALSNAPSLARKKQRRLSAAAMPLLPIAMADDRRLPGGISSSSSMTSAMTTSGVASSVPPTTTTTTTTATSGGHADGGDVAGAARRFVPRAGTATTFVVGGFGGFSSSSSTSTPKSALLPPAAVAAPAATETTATKSPSANAVPSGAPAPEARARLHTQLGLPAMETFCDSLLMDVGADEPITAESERATLQSLHTFLSLATRQNDL
jgi:Tesmin/TSO1-like CXC domain, cysteine-rich domain